MKRVLTFLLLGLVATAYVQAPAHAFQTGSVTYPVTDGGDVVAVTLNYTTRTVTWHYSSGYQFTDSSVDFNAVALWYGTNRQRSQR
jgi:hypothetical protein